MFGNLFSDYYLPQDHFPHNFYSNKNIINNISKYDMTVAGSNALLTYIIKPE